VPVPPADVMASTRVQWADMDDDERAFLVYCMHRLRQHRAARESQERGTVPASATPPAPQRLC